MKILNAAAVTSEEHRHCHAKVAQDYKGGT